MSALNDILATSPQLWLTLGGFVIGLMFGALAQATNYCVMGAVSDWRLAGDVSRLGAAALAAAVAILGAQALDAGGVTHLAGSIYLVPRLNWVGAIGGGLLFGYGMVYAGGCPSRALVRAGSGDLRALVALLALAVAALVALSGVLAGFRVGLDRATAIDLGGMGFATQSTSEVLSVLGLSSGAARTPGIVLIGGPLLIFALGPARVLSSPLNLVGGLGVGLIVSLGWALTGLAADDMAANPVAPASLTFGKPIADAIDWLERATALGLPGVSAASVFDALAMVSGGVLAMGCTIGQGVTGLSTLSMQSIRRARRSSRARCWRSNG